MFLKSRWFWICLAFTFSAAIFFSVVVHRANQPQEVIKVYKVVEPLPRKTPQSLANTVPSVGEKNKTRSETVNTYNTDISDASSDDTDRLTPLTEESYPTEESYLDELNHINVSEKSTPKQPTETDTQTAIRLVELQIEIPKRLKERLELFDLIAELAPFYGKDPELSLIRDQIQEETFEMRQTLHHFIAEYLYIVQDDSACRPGGEFYELMKANNIFMHIGTY